MSIPVYSRELPAAQNRSGLLILAGVVEIALGALSALVALITLSSLAFAGLAAAPGAPRASVGTLLPAVLVYALGAVFFIWMAVGTFRARRWARSLMVVISSIWLTGGLAGTVVMVQLLPHLFDAPPPGSPQLPEGVKTMMVWISGGVLAVIYLLLPAFFLAIYANPNVKATVEARDAQPRWTDRCPLPVLALSLMLAYPVVGLLFALAFPAFPFFGIFLTGLPALVLMVLLAAVSAYLAREVYLLHLNGWRGAVALTLFYVLSSAVTFARIPLLDLYRQMGIPAEQVELMKPLIAAMNPLLYVVPFAVGALGFLLYVRRYFGSAAGPEVPPTAMESAS